MLIFIMQLAKRWLDRTNHEQHQEANRARGANDRRHGPEDQFLPYHNTDRSRALEVPDAVLSSCPHSKN